MRVAVGHQYHYEHQYSHLIHAAPQFNLNLFYLFISPSLPSTATPFHHSWEGLPLAVVWPGDRPESTEWKWKERWQKKNVSKSEMKTEIEDIEHCEENLNQNRNGNCYKNENNLLNNLSKFPREKKTKQTENLSHAAKKIYSATLVLTILSLVRYMIFPIVFVIKYRCRIFWKIIRNTTSIQ